MVIFDVFIIMCPKPILIEADVIIHTYMKWHCMLNVESYDEQADGGQ